MNMPPLQPVPEPASIGPAVSRLLDGSQDPLARAVCMLAEASDANQRYFTFCAAAGQRVTEVERQVVEVERRADEADQRVEALATDVVMAQETADRALAASRGISPLELVLVGCPNQELEVVRAVVQSAGRLVGLTILDAAINSVRVKNPRLSGRDNRSFAETTAGPNRPSQGTRGPPDLIVSLDSATLRSTLLERVRHRGGIQSDELGLEGVFLRQVKIGLFKVLKGAKFMLFRDIRARAKELGYIAAWHGGGNIFVRKSQGTRARIVFSVVDLENLRD